MKKVLSIVLIGVLCAMLLCGCGGVDKTYCGDWKASVSKYDSFASQNVTQTDIISLYESGTCSWKVYQDHEFYSYTDDGKYGHETANVGGEWYVKSGYVYVELDGTTYAFKIQDKNTLIPERDTWGDSFKRVK